MSTFNEQVEAGARAMFMAMRQHIYAEREFEELPLEHQEHWRENFAIGFAAAQFLADQQTPQYRVRFVPLNSDGEKGIWYTGTPLGYEHPTIMAARDHALPYQDTGGKTKIEERWVTEWAEVEP